MTNKVCFVGTEHCSVPTVIISFCHSPVFCHPDPLCGGEGSQKLELSNKEEKNIE
jgi:hypothetical protein